jgi:siroheme synthase-like protein
MMAAVRPAGQRVVIVGAGAVARRRASHFAAYGAKVKMYDPFAPETDDSDLPANVKLYRRRAAKKDLQGAWLVVVATDDAETNATIGQWANELGLECNRADDVDAGSFAVPALLENDSGWQLAILGGEAGPLFSTWMKGLLTQVVGLPKVAHVYNALAVARSELRGHNLPQAQRGDNMRIVMSAALEADDEVDGAELVRQLVG